MVTLIDEDNKIESEDIEEKEIEEKIVEKSQDSSIKVKKSDVWRSVSLLLGILLVVSIFTNGFHFGNSPSGSAVAISADKAAEKALDFINANLLQPGMEATSDGVEEKNGLYNIKLNIAGTPYDSYVTKDGSLLFPSVIDLNEVVEAPAAAAPVSVEPAEKASAELYIFSYCPAGSSTLDTFAEAAQILKDVADVKVKFFSNMHGEYEKQENLIQECIQEVDPETYWDYAVDFYEDVYTKCASTRDTECDKEAATALMTKVGIDSDAVFACVEEQGEDLYAADKADAQALSLQYSPSVVVNGAYLGNAPRTPEGLKATICSGFIDAPEVCGETTLSEEQTASTGSC
ncbi:MAG: DsbA family protein [Nanoarchaeota archaeon]|nr:DsbA family protein [Nanoarchaeota archaeon]